MSDTLTTPDGVAITPNPTGRPRRRRGLGARAALVLGILTLLGSAGLFLASAGLQSVDDRWRDGDYLTSDTVSLHTDGHALAVEHVDFRGLDGDWLLGTTRIRVTSADDHDVFVGLATKAAAEEYLRGVEHSVVTDISDSEARYSQRAGGAPAVRPADAGIWRAQSTGNGRQSLTWTPSDGSWVVVVMQADGTGPVDVVADAGATVPALGKAICGLQIASAFAAITGVGLVGVSVLRRLRSRRA